MAEIIGEAKLELSTDDSKLRSGLTEAEGTTRKSLGKLKGSRSARAL